ncbi:MAG: ribbon-helix-helix protein, CopG family [Clostridia bacterium]
MNDEILKIEIEKYRGETEVISARIPQSLVWEITKIAKDTGKTKNDIIKLCLAFAVDRIEIQKEENK